MAIVQEERLDAPQPEIVETRYGAEYVTAATETPVAEEPVAESDEETVEVADKPKKGRPRKKK